MPVATLHSQHQRDKIVNSSPSSCICLWDTRKGRWIRPSRGCNTGSNALTLRCVRDGHWIPLLLYSNAGCPTPTSTSTQHLTLLPFSTTKYVTIRTDPTTRLLTHPTPATAVPSLPHPHSTHLGLLCSQLSTELGDLVPHCARSHLVVGAPARAVQSNHGQPVLFCSARACLNLN